MTITIHSVPVRAVSCGPRQHFFGYYDKTPWDATGRYLAALETAATDRPPTPDDVATVGLIDVARNTFEPLAETRAWNWQQGCMLHWLPSAPEREIIFNDRVDGQLVSVVLDIRHGTRRILPLPIYALSHDGHFAVTPSFARLARQRPGYGYAGVPDPWQDINEPEDDGIYRMDLDTGAYHLILSVAQVARFRRHPSMDGVAHWFNHLQFNQDGSRFIFLHRWRSTPGRWQTQLLTANADGSDLYCVADNGRVSHFDWRDPTHILAWARQPDRGDHYYLFTDRGGAIDIVDPDMLTSDGHCSYSPDRRWLLTDTYPDDADKRTLLLYHPATRRRLDIGRFYSPPNVSGELRCDLHPRWSRDGRSVCIDSAHTGERQMYVLDVEEVIATYGAIPQD